MKPFTSSLKRRDSPRSSIRSLEWRPRTPDEIARKKHRQVINKHLKRIGKAAGRELSLDDDGVCCFTFKKFVVVVEVPEDNSDVCLFYSKVCHVRPEDNSDEVLRVIDQFNQRQVNSSITSTESQEPIDSSNSSEMTCQAVDPLQGTTRLGMKDQEEVNLRFSVLIQGLSFQDTADHLERFIKTAVLANRKLYKAKSTPAPVPVVEEPSRPKPICCRQRMWSMDSHTSVSDMSQLGLFSRLSLLGSSTTSS